MVRYRALHVQREQIMWATSEAERRRIASPSSSDVAQGLQSASLIRKGSQVRILPSLPFIRPALGRARQPVSGGLAVRWVHVISHLPIRAAVWSGAVTRSAVNREFAGSIPATAAKRSGDSDPRRVTRIRFAPETRGLRSLNAGNDRQALRDRLCRSSSAW